MVMRTAVVNSVSTEGGVARTSTYGVTTVVLCLGPMSFIHIRRARKEMGWVIFGWWFRRNHVTDRIIFSFHNAHTVEK